MLEINGVWLVIDHEAIATFLDCCRLSEADNFLTDEKRRRDFLEIKIIALNGENIRNIGELLFFQIVVVF
ncbi:hypothetical protein D9M68_818290 [compost metagenome]